MNGLYQHGEMDDIDIVLWGFVFLEEDVILERSATLVALDLLKFAYLATEDRSSTRTGSQKGDAK